jgi:proteic killer suppression protein
VIRSFRDPETERIWNGERSRKLPSDMQDRALIRLRMLNQAKTLDDLRNPPSNRLHALKDDRAGQHSISINIQWRICFVWRDGGADGVLTESIRGQPEEPILRRPVEFRMIRKLKSGWRIYSRKKDPKTGKRRNLGTFATRAAAEKHEREVQYFKRH